jgi:hypothetical protein
VLADIARNSQDWDVTITAYKRFGGADIIYELSRLDFSYYSNRKEAAVKLIQLLKNNPKSASLLWERVSEIARKPHDDSPHSDLGNRSSSCHEDIRHTDNGGIGMEFPPYPFND